MLTSFSNPILAEFRKYTSQVGNHTPAWLAAHWTKTEFQWEEMCLKDEVPWNEPLGTPEDEAHAFLVLTRLARVGGEA